MIRKLFTLIFAVLSVAFLGRALFYGYKWLSHAASPDLNYKALTVWCLVYVVVCAGIAWRLTRLPREELA